MSLMGPSWLMLAGASAVSAALAFGGGLALQGKLKDGEAAALRAQQNADALRLTNLNIAETARRMEAQQEADREKTQRDARERAAADAIAAAERDGLRDQVSRLARRAAADRTAAGVRTPAEALGAVFGECVARYRALERDATDDRSRGLACEQRYDALSATGTKLPN